MISPQYQSWNSYGGLLVDVDTLGTSIAPVNCLMLPAAGGLIDDTRYVCISVSRFIQDIYLIAVASQSYERFISQATSLRYPYST